MLTLNRLRVTPEEFAAIDSDSCSLEYSHLCGNTYVYKAVKYTEEFVLGENDEDSSLTETWSYIYVTADGGIIEDQAGQHLLAGE